MSRLIIVSNRLVSNVIIQKDHAVRLTAGQGGIANGLRSIYKQKNNLWVGWPGVFTNSEEERQEITDALKSEQAHPIFLTKKEIEQFYHGCCNGTLWPNFHYFNQYTQYDSKNWKAYVRVNKKYAQTLVSLAKSEDIFWIHDYQLLLVPQLLREHFPKASIGFFLHTPFPALHSFARLPLREELLSGMLGADFIAFHTYDDVQNFLFCVSRFLGITYLNDSLHLHGRVVRVDCMPMGIDYQKYETLARSKETQERKQQLRSDTLGKKLILSIDRLDYTKGIPQRLRAFDKFLQSYAQYQGKVSMILIVVPSREEGPYYKKLKEEIDLLVGQINGRYSRMNWQPLQYFYKSFATEWLSAFYTLCDIALITPLIDGMNLVCKEFVASKKNKGVLILSEMAGASKELYQTLLVNPHDEDKLCATLYKALRLPLKEQAKRLAIMQEALRKNNVQMWLSRFIHHLQETKIQQKQLTAKYLDSEERVELYQIFSDAERRIIFLDYDGTLVNFSPHPALSTPDQNLLQILKPLIYNDKNLVVIISGRAKEDLEQWFKHLPIHMVAEHGAWRRTPEGKWQSIADLSTNWKKDVLHILEEFAARTPGSIIENKHFSLTWHYREVEQIFGKLRAWELINHLRYITAQMDLSILEGNKVVEIKHAEINKGKAASYYLHQYKPDFSIAFGDDWTDEDTFRALPKTGYSVKVGEGVSIAKYRLNNYLEVRQLLNILSFNLVA